MNVLVTGATGRIGRATVEELRAHGHDVRMLVHPDDDRLAAIGKDRGVVIGAVDDLRAVAAAVEGIDSIIHLAALIPGPATDEDELLRTNLWGTWTLLRAAARAPRRVGRFVLASSDAVYWTGPNDPALYLPVDESHPRRPGDVYGFSKLAGEELCATFCRGEGLRFAIARFGVTASPAELVDPASLFGRQWFASPVLAGYERDGLTQPAAVLGDALGRLGGADALVLEQDRFGRYRVQEINDARNTARGLRLMIETPQADGEVFNLAAATPFAQNLLIERLAARLSLPVISVTVGTTFHPWYVSSAKAQTMLGYEAVGSVLDMVDEACPGASPVASGGAR